MKPKKKAKPEKKASPAPKAPDWKKNLEEFNKECDLLNSQSDGVGFGPLEGPHRFLGHIGSGPVDHKSEAQEFARAEKNLMEALARDPEVIKAKKNPEFVAFCKQLGMPVEQVVFLTRMHQRD